MLSEYFKIKNGMVRDAEIEQPAVLKNVEVGDTETVIFKFVDGDEVRDSKEPEAIDFTMGGHHYRYKFIPENEIWIEQHQVEEDLAATMMHEITERITMKYLGVDYSTAHNNFADPAEKGFRAGYKKDIKNG